MTVGVDWEDMKHEGYKNIACWICSGHGVVSRYSMGDFEGPEECDTCGGNGSVIRYKSGTLAKFPGGPFIGSERKNISQEITLPNRKRIGN